MTQTHQHTPTATQAPISHDDIDRAFARIAPDALGTGRDAEGTLDGSDSWEHPSAAEARDLTARLGMSWDFSTWADAQALAHRTLQTADHQRV